MSQKGLWDNQESSRLGSDEAGFDFKPSLDSPLALRMTPMSFEQFLGQQELMGPGKALRNMVETDNIVSMLFWGPPGTGKTALARLIASKTKSLFRELSAVTSGVQDVRKVIVLAKEARQGGRRTILFIDEIHRFTKVQQDALLPHVEAGIVTLIGATTENPYFSVNSALLSRMRVFRFEHLSEEDITTMLRRALTDAELGLTGPEIQVEDQVLDHIVAYSKGDGRTALNVLEALYNATGIVDGVKTLTAEKALEVTQSPALFYDKTGDQHYDIISAYIKSMRGSSPDAALYWLARMLHSGEDPRYVARRLVICASEDVGLADPMALVVAEAAFRACEQLGMPEARIPLAQATLYVALAPKSNSAYLAIDRAFSDVESKSAYPVPAHLRGTGYSGAKDLGHGLGYLYPHDYPSHFVDQEYLPEGLKNVRYYEPSKNDFSSVKKS